MPALRLDGLTKVYPRGTVAVNRVSLAVGDGELLVVLGPSGCGKTTLLRLLAGLEQPTHGRIEIADRDVTALPPHERGVAMVFQHFALYPHLSVYGNLAFALNLRRVARGEVDARVRAAAAALEIGHLLDRRPRKLSGGEQQRVAIGRATVRRPRCFLFDEPLSNLDAPLRRDLRTELKRLHLQQAATTLYVTHDQEEAMSIADRIAVMREGAIEQCAPPRDLYRRPANRFVAGFLGSPPMNLLPARVVQADGMRLVVGDARMPVPPALLPGLAVRVGQEIVLGVHAEDVAVRPPGSQALDDVMRASVLVCESFGDRTLVHFQAGQAKIAARCGPEFQPAAGSTWNLMLDLAQAQFFEAGKPGRNLELAAAGEPGGGPVAT